MADAGNASCGGVVIVLAAIIGVEHEFCNVGTDILTSGVNCSEEHICNCWAG